MGVKSEINFQMMISPEPLELFGRLKKNKMNVILCSIGWHVVQWSWEPSKGSKWPAKKSLTKKLVLTAILTISMAPMTIELPAIQ
jgi:hypothetical protein